MLKKKDNTSKNLIKILTFLIIVAAVIITCNDRFINIIEIILDQNTNSFILDENISNQLVLDESKLNVIYFYVGEADCTLIALEGHYMLIDCGNVDDGDKVVDMLKSLNIDNLDYVIGTHIHEDHVGCLDKIINNFNIDKLYMPHNDTSDRAFYKRIKEAIAKKNMNKIEPNIGDTFELAGAKCEVMSVDNSDPEEINEESIVIELSYGTQKFLFMADAERKNENARQWNDVDVLKVGHHGSNSSTSYNFLNQTKPEISIISVGKDNEYGYPKQKVINRIEKIGSEIYRTDIDGTIQIESDGTNSKITKSSIDLDVDVR